jgi:hypothetical protein
VQPPCGGNCLPEDSCQRPGIQRCGAIESRGVYAFVSFAPFNGFAIDPRIQTVLTKPELGKPSIASIVTQLGTVSTLLALGVRAPESLLLDGIKVEVLLDPRIFPSLYFALAAT